MNRKLRTISFALFAVFALSAVAPSGASAIFGSQDHLTSNVSSTHITAKSTTFQKIQTVTNGNDQISCGSVNFKGTMEGSEVTELTVSPEYSNCIAVKGGTSFSANVTTNGCHYRLTTGTETTVTPGQHATAHLECPKEKSIEVDVTAFKFPCIAIGPQLLRGARYTGDFFSENAIEVEMTVHGIKSKELETIACNEATFEDGQYTGNITVEGFKNAAHTEVANLGVVET